MSNLFSFISFLSWMAPVGMKPLTLAVLVPHWATRPLALSQPSYCFNKEKKRAVVTNWYCWSAIFQPTKSYILPVIESNYSSCIVHYSTHLTLDDEWQKYGWHLNCKLTLQPRFHNCIMATPCRDTVTQLLLYLFIHLITNIFSQSQIAWAFDTRTDIVCDS